MLKWTVTPCRKRSQMHKASQTPAPSRSPRRAVWAGCTGISRRRARSSLVPRASDSELRTCSCSMMRAIICSRTRIAGAVRSRFRRWMTIGCRSAVSVIRMPKGTPAICSRVLRQRLKHPDHRCADGHDSPFGGRGDYLSVDADLCRLARRGVGREAIRRNDPQVRVWRVGYLRLGVRGVHVRLIPGPEDPGPQSRTAPFPQKHQPRRHCCCSINS